MAISARRWNSVSGHRELDPQVNTRFPGTEGTLKAPLPERIRPADFSLFMGQKHLEKRLRTLLELPRLPSLLFFGPPGCGKVSR